MIIDSFHVKNFRCIHDEMLPCEDLTSIIGPNGSGKSTFLKALHIFYDPQAKISEDDFYNKDTSKDIIISVTYKHLTHDEKLRFKKYIRNDKLTVDKIIKQQNGRYNQKYHGNVPKNPDFELFRNASGAKLKTEYNTLRDSDYSNLPIYTRKDEAEKSLQSWEESNPDNCELKRDDGQFFGFTEVGNANLGQNTRFIYIPAVHDASEEASDGKGTILNEIMDIVVRSVLEKNEEYISLQEETQKRYNTVVNSKTSELNELQGNLSEILNIYVPEAEVKLNWIDSELVKLPTPKAKIKLVEDEYSSLVEHTGHGLQRAFIMTLFQFLASMPSSNKKSIMPIQNIIIGIEEPEIYQHPNRQRHLAKILLDLSTNGIQGTIDKAQIIYTTHSPLFVDLNKLNNIRKLRKVKENSDEPKRTKVSFTSLDKVAKVIEINNRKQENSYPASKLEAQLTAVMTPWMNEAFFADLVVLVEGEEDLAVLKGFSSDLKPNLESRGISIIPCLGKGNIIKLTALFKEINIPIYCIWDSDDGKSGEIKNNKNILRLFGYECEEDWPEIVTNDFACFKDKIGPILKKEVGESLYDEVLTEFSTNNHIEQKKALKKSKFIEAVMKKANEEDKSSDTIKKIMSKILLKRDNIDKSRDPEITESEKNTENLTQNQEMVQYPH